MRRVLVAAASVANWLELHAASGSLEPDRLTAALAEAATAAAASATSAGSGCLGTVLGSRWKVQPDEEAEAETS